MPVLVIPNSFVPSTFALSSEVNANFSAIKDLLNTTKLDASNLQPDTITPPAVADEAITRAKIDDVERWPIGSPIATFAATPDPGFLFCYGQLVSTTTYAALFARIGHVGNGGVDPGSGNFKIPDLRGRGLFGLDNIGGGDAGRLTVANTLGFPGGEENHTLSITELPPHGHTLTMDAVGDHQHGQGTLQFPTHPGGGTGGGSQEGGPGPTNAAPLRSNSATASGAFGLTGGATNSAGAHTPTGVANNSGGLTPHNNMPPYMLVNWQIRY